MSNNMIVTGRPCRRARSRAPSASSRKCRRLVMPVNASVRASAASCCSACLRPVISRRMQGTQCWAHQIGNAVDAALETLRGRRLKDDTVRRAVASQDASLPEVGAVDFLEEAHVSACVRGRRPKRFTALNTPDKVLGLALVAPRPAGLGHRTDEGLFFARTVDFYFGRHLFQEEWRRPGLHPAVAEVDLGVLVPAIVRERA